MPTLVGLDKRNTTPMMRHYSLNGVVKFLALSSFLDANKRDRVRCMAMSRLHTSGR